MPELPPTPDVPAVSGGDLEDALAAELLAGEDDTVLPQTQIYIADGEVTA